MRAAFRIALIVLTLLACLPLHFLARLTTGRSLWPRRFLGWVSRISGARVRTVGTPLPSHVLLVANHRSWLDILVLAGGTGCSFVAKAEIARWPAIGWLAGLNATVFIERTRRADTGRQAHALAAALAAGQPVALFPEGATHDGPGLLPFRAALFAAVAPPPAGVRVQPVFIDYGAAERDIAWGEESAGSNALRLLGRRGTLPVVLHFLPPLAERADRKSLALAARTAIIAVAGSAPHRP